MKWPPANPGTGNAGVWTEVPCSPSYGLLPWTLLLQFTASKFMVYSFGLDFVPRRNWLLPLANSVSHNSYWLQTRGSPYCLHTVPWPRGLFSTPVLGSLTFTVSHVSVQPTPFSTLIRISLLSLLHESQLREQGRAACHWYPINCPNSFNPG